MKTKLTLLILLCGILFVSGDLNAQQEEIKVNYKDSIATIEGLMAKELNFVQITKKALEITMAPNKGLIDKVRVEKEKELKKLNKELKKNKITQAEYDHQLSIIDKKIKKIESAELNMSSGFTELFEKSNKKIDSLKQRKVHFESQVQ
ncbi:MAG: hypothetical protein CL613_08805 [Aquimarina sp.]|nr:hypothetical protein [Aquimarina sp.]